MKRYKKETNKVHLVREPSGIKMAKITSSRSASEFGRELYEELGTMTINESFFVLSLNNANNVTDYTLLSTGGITGTLVDVRMVAKLALETLAVAVILIHNHPSGTLRPSDADIRLTDKLKKGLGTLDIKVLDHIILTEESYFSFADEDMV